MASLSCATSGDGRYVAVRRGPVVTIHDLAPDDAGALGTTIAEGTVPHDGGLLTWAGAHVVQLVTVAARTVVTSMSLPKLKAQTIEIPLPLSMVASTGRYLLLAGGPTAYVVHVQLDSVGYAPMRVAGSVDWAVGVPDDQFLVTGSRGVELWDAASRRPGAKVRLQVASPLEVGVGGIQRSLLWVTRASRPELATVRISDGKPGLIRLGAVPTHPTGHPQSSWVICDLDGTPHAVNLVTGAAEALPAAPTTARAIAPRDHGAYLVQLSGSGELEVWELGSTRPATGAGPTTAGLTLDVGVGASAAAASARAIATAATASVRAVAAAAPPTATRGRVALRPDVTVALRGGPGPAEPPSLGRFVAPDLERRLSSLAAELRRTWVERVCDAWLADADAPPDAPRAVPRDEIVRRLARDLRRLVVALPHGTGDVDDDGKLRLRRRLVDDRAAAPWQSLRLSRPGAAPVDVAIDDADLAELGRALGRLGAGATADEIADRDAEPAARRLFEAAAAAGMTEAAPATPTFAGQLAPGTMVTLGGPTVLANLGGAHVLVDPVLGPGPAHGDAARDAAGLAPPVVADLPPLAAIVLTSDDASCLDVATLALLDKRVRVYLPPPPEPDARAPRADWLLGDLGFTDVVEVRIGETHAVGDGGAIVVLPGPAASPRHRARAAYVLRDPRGAALVAGTLPLAADDVDALARAIAPIAAETPVSPLVLPAPGRRVAAIERGWQWLFTPASEWVRPHPRAAGDLGRLRDAARAELVVLSGPVDAGTATGDVRPADVYDRYALGGGQDGWLEPRSAADAPPDLGDDLAGADA